MLPQCSLSDGPGGFGEDKVEDRNMAIKVLKQKLDQGRGKE